MNELIFCLHIFLVVLFSLGALRLGVSALTTWSSLQMILANLFVLKQIDFLNFHITCSDVFAIGSILNLNLLQEYYGSKVAQRSLVVTFFSMACFVLMAKIHLTYLPNGFDQTQDAFKQLLSPAPRLLFASVAVFGIVQQLDLHFFTKLKNAVPHLPLSIRNALTLFVTQGIDTLLFSIFGLWGLVAHLMDVIMMGFLIKTLIIFLLSLFLPLTKRFVHVSSTK